MSEAPVSQETLREFVVAGHGNLPRVREMLEADPRLLNMGYPWSPTDSETAIQGAAQVGSSNVAEYLLMKGAPLSICTAAMLGKSDEVEKMLSNDPKLSETSGAHGIPLLPHAALSGDPELVELVWTRGARRGATMALHNSVSRRKAAVTRWLLENASPDLSAKDYRGKTALTMATESGDRETEDLLRKHGARE